MADPPRHLTWNYDRVELIADGVVHVIGVGLGVIGAIALVTAVCASLSATTAEIASVSIYSATLVAMLGCSAAYNMWPVSPRKWLLRRFDHSAIYLLIAGTYTPLVAQMKIGVASVALLAGIWATAVAGLAVKWLLPGRFDRIAIGLYLLLGWSGAAAYDVVAAALPTSTLYFILAGGLLYSVGVVFHVWRGLRFQNAIWHVFVLLGAAAHYAAILYAVI